VRSLAQQCADSSQQIRQLIETNNKQVNEGARAVSEVSKALNQISVIMQDVVRNIGNVVKNSQEQSQYIGQITSLVHNFENDLQSNAALVTQCVQSVGLLEAQTQVLSNMTGYFTIHKGSLSTH
jgi:methyl-accepting chemotaxis protein